MNNFFLDSCKPLVNFHGSQKLIMTIFTSFLLVFMEMGLLKVLTSPILLTSSAIWDLYNEIFLETKHTGTQFIFFLEDNLYSKIKTAIFELLKLNHKELSPLKILEVCQFSFQLYTPSLNFLITICLN